MRASYLRRSAGARIFDGVNVLLLLVFAFLVVYPFYNQLVISFDQGIDASERLWKIQRGHPCQSTRRLGRWL